MKRKSGINPETIRGRCRYLWRRRVRTSVPPELPPPTIETPMPIPVRTPPRSAESRKIVASALGPRDQMASDIEAVLRPVRHGEDRLIVQDAVFGNKS
jgi:hypothetical protein